LEKAAELVNARKQMDFSKFKIELYDLFGLLIPGLILQTDWLIAKVGWHGYITTVSGLSGNLIAGSMALSYVLGHLIQEAGDMVVHYTTPERYLKRARDKFWAQDDGRTVRELLKTEIGHEIHSVDVAYDYCLSRAKSSFAKRDTFIATSDLARSFLFLAFTTALATIIAIWKTRVRGWSLFLDCAGILGLWALVSFISWRRMMRFREFADKPVFSAYLASLKEPSGNLTKTASPDGR
jgi:hypothetical protein